jgi:hypothetical protein
MSVESVVARIAELTTALRPPVQAAAAARTTGAATVVDPAAFASLLAGARTVGTPWSPAATGPWGVHALSAAGAPSGPVAAAVLAAARAEIGVAEQPPGSNDGPRIAEYRQAVAGAPGPGPWCAYFTSWLARQAGAPLGNAGEGFGSVDALYAWAQSAGKAIPAAGAVPQPGDLIVWDEHIGVVESVAPDGTITTIEGNSDDRVARRTYGPDGGGAIGYVRLG